MKNIIIIILILKATVVMMIVIIITVRAYSESHESTILVSSSKTSRLKRKLQP